MKILEQLRRNLFWTIDTLKGNKVKKHLDDIAVILENYSSEQSNSKREEYLAELLNHAVKTTSFYSTVKNYKSISDFPVITKIDIRESYDGLLSQTYKRKKYIEVATSGTTGIPFKVRQDNNKKQRNSADAFYFGKKGGYQIGDRLYYIRKWVKETKRTRLGLFITNIKEINVADFSKFYLNRLVKKMARDSSTKAILGYSSALSDICRHLEETNTPLLKSKYSSIISMSEALSDSTREKMEKYFGTSVVSRYSNMENGIFAQQLLNEGNDYHINWASYYLEILNIDDDTPVKNGELGRIVVTDLFNYYMPLIRYDTGDLGIMNSDNAFYNKAPVLKTIEGRKMDILYNTSGQPISPYAAFEMEYFPELKQFQLIQEGEKEYIAKLNLDGIFKNETELANRLKKYLGKDAIINFVYVDEFPQLASGKRRLTVNNYKPMNTEN